MVRELDRIRGIANEDAVAVGLKGAEAVGPRLRLGSELEVEVGCGGGDSVRVTVGRPQQPGRRTFFQWWFRFRLHG